MRYIIVNPIDGTVTSTDSFSVAQPFAMSDDYIVIDAAANETIVEEERHKIPGAKALGN